MPSTKKLELGWFHKAKGRTFVQQSPKDGPVRRIDLIGPKDYPVTELIDTALRLFYDDDTKKILKNTIKQLGTHKKEVIDDFHDNSGKTCSVWQHLYDFPKSRFKLFLMTSEIVEEDSSDTDCEKSKSDEVENDSKIKRPRTPDARLKDPFETSPPKTRKLEKELNRFNQPLQKELSYSNLSSNNSNLASTPSPAYENLTSKSERGQSMKSNDCDRKIFQETDDAPKHVKKSTIEDSQKSQSLVKSLPQKEPGFEKGLENNSAVANFAAHLKLQVATNNKPMTNDVGSRTFQKPLPPIVCKKLKAVEPDKKKSDKPNSNDKIPPKPVNRVQFKSPLQSSSFFQERSVEVIERQELVINSRDLKGKGNFGEVHGGTWNGRVVAVKTMPYLCDPKTDERIAREVLILKNVQHDNLIGIFGVCLEPTISSPSLHIVMELFHSDCLHKVIFDRQINQEHKLDYKKKTNISLQICEAVEYLHNRDILHRDIKPSNILISQVDEENQYNVLVKLIDFGLSTCTEISASVTAVMKSNLYGGTRGTPRYMAPEIMEKQSPASTFSDIWSLTVTLFELFTEYPAWKLKTTDQNKELKELYKKTTVPDLKDVPKVYQDIFERGFSYLICTRPKASDFVELFE